MLGETQGCCLALSSAGIYQGRLRQGIGDGAGVSQGCALTFGFYWPSREPGRTLRQHGSRAGALSPRLGRGLSAAGRERLRPGSKTQVPLFAAWRGPSCRPDSKATGRRQLAGTAEGSTSRPGWNERLPQRSTGWVLPWPRELSAITKHPPCSC